MINGGASCCFYELRLKEGGIRVGRMRNLSSWEEGDLCRGGGQLT